MLGRQFDAQGFRRASTQTLKTKGPGSPEELEDARAHYSLTETVKDRLPDQVRSRANCKTFWHLEDVTCCASAYDAHRISVRVVLGMNRSLYPKRPRYELEHEVEEE